jgi:hypothetical protein
MLAIILQFPAHYFQSLIISYVGLISGALAVICCIIAFLRETDLFESIKNKGGRK